MIKYFLVVVTVFITLISALIIDYSSQHYYIYQFQAIMLVAFVIFINIAKFYIWGSIHTKYDLKDSYPIVASIYPLYYVSSIIKQDAHFNVIQTLAIALILIGIYISSGSNNRKE